MTVTTYAGLSTAVFRRLNRTAETTPFNDALELAEAEINRRLALSPVRPQHTISTSTISTEYLATPSDILDVESFELTATGDRLLATTPQNMEAMFEADTTTGKPRYYAQVGTQFRFYPAPDASYAASMIYWAKVPALTSVATTNWLSLAHPDVYFHGALAHLYQEYFDEANADKQAGLFDIAIEKVLSAYPKRQDRSPRHDNDLNAIATNRSGFNIFTG
jgi:hypothetical protein